MFQTNTGVLIAFAAYLLLMLAIGVYYYRSQQELSDYILGGRSLGPWITSMSAEASDMSGWMLMGLPGFAYSTGISAFWTAFGLALGTYLNWHFVSIRLRNYTEIANNSLTMPDYLKNRFHDDTNLIRLISAVFILIFFLIYTSSGFVAGGKLFEIVFGMDYFTALLAGASVVVIYTFLGGFLAVCWTDFIQGCMMFLAIVLVPVAGSLYAGGFDVILERVAATSPQLLDLVPDKGPAGIIAIISAIGWGLGYFGQPHILVRFMAIQDASELHKAKHIAMTWVIISLSAAVFVGLVGKVVLTAPLIGADSEKVFLIMSEQLFPPFLSGLIWSAVLAAIMSTASSQLLVTASAISKDFYHTFIRTHASEKELIYVSRITVLVVSAAAIYLALDPDNYILTMVAYAWAGFGAAFGPTILLSLFWKRMTKNGALAGIIIGGVTVLIWKQFAWFDLYEIVPGFIFSLLAIILVSVWEGGADMSIQKEFDNAIHFKQKISKINSEE
ncbi:MAG: sodium/proline symporter PutP [Megasphaera sp.]|jgi:sodium/proline symporter|uniref:sodium/proline symporter PutP n=1 Tax=Megasphaera sueciensis TaxID=349094 RepID=UPI003D06DDC8|nr:sodium/proline symporter PutP [Megasphaera sp.]MCI1823864.1 sodium/proline symporter PutP [Megasphaera sp.]